MKIIIKDKEIELKRKFRAYIIYEAITKQSFQPKNLTDFMIFFYSVIIASCPDLEVTLEEFMEYLDENEEEFGKFIDWLGTGDAVNGQFADKESEDKKKLPTQ